MLKALSLQFRLPNLKRFRTVSIYFGAYFIIAILSFGGISVLTHKLSPYDYGIINLYSSAIPLLTPFISAGIIFPVTVEYYKKTKDEYNQFFTNAQAITLISLVFFSFIFIVFHQPLSKFLRVPSQWIIVLPLTVWFLMHTEIALSMYRMKNRPWGFAIFSVGKNLVEILLAIGLVIGLHWSWEGRLLPAVISPILFGAFAIYLLFRWQLIIKEINWKEVRRIAWVCSPFIFERLTVFVLANSDRYFIDKFDLKSTEQVGLYGVGAQVTTIISFVILSVNSAYQPYIFQNLATGNKRHVKKGTLLYILATGVAVAGLFLISPFFFRFFIGKSFGDAQVFVYYMSGGYFMWGVYNAFLAYLLFHGKNRLILYFSLIGMAVSVLLNFYLVPQYGAYGAAITGILTYTVMAAICMIFSWKYFK